MRVNEFKIWLEGVLAFQENKAEWRPTAKQWKMIYEKIISLDDSPVIYERVQQKQRNEIVPQQVPSLGLLQEEDHDTIASPNPEYSILTEQQIQALKQTASNGGGIDVPIIDSPNPKSLFI